jgi:hypothetical protein
MSEKKTHFLIDRNRLKGKIIESSLTRKEVAEKLGIAYETFSSKLNDDGFFNEKEIRVLLELFGEYIFFEKVC